MENSYKREHKKYLDIKNQLRALPPGSGKHKLLIKKIKYQKESIIGMDKEVARFTTSKLLSLQILKNVVIGMMKWLIKIVDDWVYPDER